MALPNIFQGHQVLAPWEGQNKQDNWLCDGHTQFWWLRHAQGLQTHDPTGSQAALAIATTLQVWDSQGLDPIVVHEDRQRDFWYEAVLALREGNITAYTPWDRTFVMDVADRAPTVYSPKMQAVIERMTLTYLGIRL